MVILPNVKFQNLTKLKVLKVKKQIYIHTGVIYTQSIKNVTEDVSGLFSVKFNSEGNITDTHTHERSVLLYNGDKTL